MSNRSRIDVHQHVVPPFWAKTLADHGGDPSGARSGDPSHKVLPRWSPANAITMMDSQEIATGMLSLRAPGIVGWKQNERREMARRVNEYTADLVGKRPDRFGNLATLPLPDVALSRSSSMHLTPFTLTDSSYLATTEKNIWPLWTFRR